MNFTDLAKWAYLALKERKLRSGLTVLMVVIGAMLMTSVNGLNAGTSNLINEQFSTFGANLLTVSSGGGFGHRAPSGTEISLNDQTVKTLSGVKYVDEVIPYIQGSVKLKKGQYEKTVSVTGLDQSYFKYLAPTAEILEGKYLNFEIKSEKLQFLSSYYYFSTIFFNLPILQIDNLICIFGPTHVMSYQDHSRFVFFIQF